MTVRFADVMKASDRPLAGMWVASGSPYVMEICAGAGLDWILLECEHAPNDLRAVLAQLQAAAPYPVHVVVRPPSDDRVFIKQLLDVGVCNLMIPMIESTDQARELVSSTRYPPEGVRGVGSAFARASRWNRRNRYLFEAGDDLTVIAQVESHSSLMQAGKIAAVDGIDAVFFGPADLAASMGHLGKPEHPDVVTGIEKGIEEVIAGGAVAGVNAFVESRARQYCASGARLLLMGADVTLLARGAEALAELYCV